MMPRERLTAKEIQVADLVWQGLTNREIGKIMGTTEQVIRITCEVHSTSWRMEPA